MTDDLGRKGTPETSTPDREQWGTPLSSCGGSLWAVGTQARRILQCAFLGFYPALAEPRLDRGKSKELLLQVGVLRGHCAFGIQAVRLVILPDISSRPTSLREAYVETIWLALPD